MHTGIAKIQDCRTIKIEIKTVGPSSTQRSQASIMKLPAAAGFDPAGLALNDSRMQGRVT